MNILDDLKKIKKIDKANTYGSIKAFPEQILDAWEQFEQQKTFKIPSDFKNIVLVGMGGSALAGRVIQSLFESEIKLPFEINTEYDLPGFVGQHSLVIVSSYSGNTEETLSCLKKALNQKTKVVAMTTGGQLGRMVNQGKIEGFVYQPKYNPSGYPKTAIGYSIGALLAIIFRLKLIEQSFEQIRSGLKELKKAQKDFLLGIPSGKSQVKKLAEGLKEKIPLLVASQHLKGAAYTARNEIHEIAHSHCLFFDLPEMNHHLIEAISKPKKLVKEFVYLFFPCSNYHQRNLTRYLLTIKILEELNLESVEYHLKSKSKLGQVLELVNLGGFLAFYISILNNEDPGPEPWILHFKKLLKN